MSPHWSIASKPPRGRKSEVSLWHFDASPRFGLGRQVLPQPWWYLDVMALVLHLLFCFDLELRFMITSFYNIKPLILFLSVFQTNKAKLYFQSSACRCKHRPPICYMIYFFMYSLMKWSPLLVRASYLVYICWRLLIRGLSRRFVNVEL